MKFDLLAFPDAKFFVAAPAIAKCHETAYLLSKYNLLWEISRLRYVLDPKYSGSFSSYVDDRINILLNTLPEEELTSHFEYAGYTSPHSAVFFEEYLPSSTDSILPVESRVKSGDTSFREDVRLNMTNEKFFEYLSKNTTSSAKSIIQKIDGKALNRNELFQREAIVTDIRETEKVTPNVIAILHHELDRSFSRANASAVDSLLSSEVIGVNGFRLEIISRHIWVETRRSLFRFVEKLSPNQIVMLSQQLEWIQFIKILDEEIRTIFYEIDSNQILLKKHLIPKLPSRYFGWFQEIASMIIAFIISPVFGKGEVARYLAAIFTNVPQWVLCSLSMLTNTQLTEVILDVVEKVKYVSAIEDSSNSQPLSNFGLLYSAKMGFIDSTKTK
ncbi:MAG: hypothetical protein GKR93_04445 [Gammaproteobacteria bacterium]|nr:hypothetical protein [Gammaproteobacteria bacterium]